MLDIKKIAADPEGVKKALCTRYKIDEDKEYSDATIDYLALIYQEVKLTRQAIEEAKHLQRQLEKDQLMWKRKYPELAEDD